jgi:hypothetical protein
MISQVSQSYPLYARNGAQPTADATTVTAEPTTAVAPEAPATLTAQPADAYTSSTALATAPPAEEKKAKPNWLAWGSLLAGGAAGIYWLATRGRGGDEVSKTVADAAPEVANTVAEAGQKVATAATKAVDDAQKAVAELFGIKIDSTHTADDIVDICNKRIQQEAGNDALLRSSLENLLPKAELDKLLGHQHNIAFEPNTSVYKGIRQTDGKFTPFKIGDTEFVTAKMDPGSAELVRSLHEAGADDAFAKAQLATGKYQVTGVTTHSKSGDKTAIVRFVSGTELPKQQETVIATLRADQSKEGFERAKAVAAKFKLELVKNADGYKLKPKATGSGTSEVLIPNSSFIRNEGNKDAISFVGADGRQLNSDQLTEYYRLLKSAKPEEKAELTAQFGTPKVLHPRVGTEKPIVQLGTTLADLGDVSF